MKQLMEKTRMEKITGDRTSRPHYVKKIILFR